MFPVENYTYLTWIGSIRLSWLSTHSVHIVSHRLACRSCSTNKAIILVDMVFIFEFGCEGDNINLMVMGNFFVGL